MNGNGFDWLNLPPAPAASAELHTSSGATSPAPPVSFGVSASASLFQMANKLADSVLAAPANGLAASLDNELSVPLSLTAQDLTLEESRTYIRWYSDILARTNARTITMNDVYSFLNNFKLSAQLKEQINRIFHKFLQSINIGEFFALLRLIAHALLGETPHRRLIRRQAPIPTPPSILSKKRQSDDDTDDYDAPQEEHPQENKQLDLDSFTQFMLTGHRPDEKPRKRKKQSKSVKFSDQIVTDIHDSQGARSPMPSPPVDQLDYSLPMDHLLQRISQQQHRPMSPNQQPDEEEQQILKDMESQINHFRNLHNVDTASIDGVPAPLTQGDHLRGSDQLLNPNMTGPNQMARYLARQQNSVSPLPQPNQQSPTPLKPNMTGPYDMMKIFSPSPNTTAEGVPQQNSAQGMPHISLQSFADEMTGNTAANTLANSRLEDSSSATNADEYLEAGRIRSMSLPLLDAQRVTSPSFYGNGSAPRPPPPVLRGWSYTVNGKAAAPNGAPPPPPPPRRRGASMTASATSPPPLPGKEPMDAELTRSSRSDSTANILDDLKALQAEVDKIRDMTGGF